MAIGRLPAHLNVLPSATKTVAGSPYNFDIPVPKGANGVTFTLDQTARTGGTTTDFKVQRKDPTSGKFVDIPGASIVQIVANTGTVQLTIHPHIVASANVKVADVLAATIRGVLTLGVGTDATLSLGADFD